MCAVLHDGLLPWGDGALGGAGSFAGAVAGSVYDDLVAGVDEPVEQGFGDDRVGEQRVPVNWNWLRFRMMVLAFDLLVSVSGVSS